MKQIEEYRKELDKFIENHNLELSDKIIVAESLKTELLVFTAQKTEV